MATENLERIYKISVDGTQAINQLDKIAKSATGIDSKLGQVGSALKGAFAGAAVIGAVTAVAGAFKNAANAMDELFKASQKVGVTTESLSRLKYAAEQSGVGFEGLQTGLRKLNKSLADVETGTSSAARALRELGVKGGDSPEEALSKIAEAFASVPDSAQKTALALELFGKSGADLIPLLNEGADGLKELTDRAEKLGLVLDEKTAKQAELFNDSLDDISLSMGAITKQITAGALPALSAFSNTLAGTLSVSESWKTVGKALGETFIFIADKVIILGAALYTSGTYLKAFASAASDFGRGNFSDASKTISDWYNSTESLVGAVSKLRTELNKVNTSTENLGDPGKDVSVSANKFKLAANQLKDATDSSSKAVKATKEELTAIQEIVETLQKVGISRNNAVQQIAFLQSLNPETIKQIGVSTNDVAEAIKKLNETADPEGTALKKFAEGVKDSLNPMNELQRTTEKLNQALDAGYLSWEQYADAVFQASEKLNPEKLEKTKDALDEIGVAIGNTLSTSIGNFVDVIFEADQSFQEFISNTLKGIAKLIVQILILRTLKSSLGNTPVGDFFFPSAKGNSFDGGTTLPKNSILTQPTFFKFADGGVFGGRNGVAGEAGPEAVMPLKRDANGKLGVIGSPVNINISNTMSESASVQIQETNRADGTKEIAILIEKRVKEMIGNGSLDRSMRQSYGLSRAPA
jgi:methyl-accepting chemotaxis protein